jgi:hypothetical protein
MLRQTSLLGDLRLKIRLSPGTKISRSFSRIINVRKHYLINSAIKGMTTNTVKFMNGFLIKGNRWHYFERSYISVI